MIKKGKFQGFNNRAIVINYLNRIFSFLSGFFVNFMKSDLDIDKTFPVEIPRVEGFLNIFHAVELLPKVGHNLSSSREHNLDR